MAARRRSSKAEKDLSERQRYWLKLKRPRFSWTRIWGECDVQGGGGNGSIEEGEGFGANGGSP
jgi:hypothetical protein